MVQQKMRKDFCCKNYWLPLWTITMLRYLFNPFEVKEKALSFDKAIGWGIGIRTPTNRVRVCRATVTLFPNVTFLWATDIYYTQLYGKVNTFFGKI